MEIYLPAKTKSDSNTEKTDGDNLLQQDSSQVLMFPRMSQEPKHRSQIFHLHSVSYSSGKLPYLRAFMCGFIENAIALVFLRTSFCDGLIASVV